MDHITIPIPDGMDSKQKEEVTKWLTLQVAEVLPERLPCEDDPAWLAETAQRIRRGMEDVRAGRTRPAGEVMTRLADKYGLALPE
ncbi:hypothetical protein OT109_07200 [Phycisphaeraceae bacterium D3-23]